MLIIVKLSINLIKDLNKILSMKAMYLLLVIYYNYMNFISIYGDSNLLQKIKYPCAYVFGKYIIN